MTFEKFIKRHTKTVFMAVIAVMAVTLVINFGPGGGCDARVQEGGEAGIIFDGMTVSRSEFQESRSTAYAYSRWSWLSSAGFMSKSQLIQAIQRNGGRWWNDPKPDKIDEIAWERIILARYARGCGISVARDEVASEIRSAYAAAQQGGFNAEQYATFVRGMFSAEVQPFERMVEDSLAIERYLDLELDAPSATYSDLMARIMKDERRFKVDVGGINPEELAKELVAPGNEEILKHFEANKATYQAPAKCQLEYLLSDVEKMKAALPEPAEDDLKKYYDDNKDQFIREDAAAHSDDDGHDHGAEPAPTPKKDYKPFDEVRIDIASKVKQRNADKAVADTMKRVNTALGALISSRKKEIAAVVEKDEAWSAKPASEKNAETLRRFREGSGDLIAKLAEQFKAEVGGLTHDITVLFTAKQVEEVEKAVGKSTGSFNLSNWVFQTGLVGDFVPSVVKTEKGALLFRLARKTEAYSTDLTDPVKQQISRKLAKDKLKDLARKAATEMVQKILVSPNRLAAFAELRASRPGFFRGTNYFKPDDTTDLGLDDASIGRAVKTAVTNDESVTPGFATQIDGKSVGGEKTDWAFVAVVSDVATSPPASIETAFTAERDEVEKSERTKRRTQKIKEVVSLSNLRDKMKPAKSDEPKPATP